MSYAYDISYRAAENAPAAERAAFIRRTYAHVAGAILAFAGIEAFLLNLPNIDQIVGMMFGFGRLSWLIIMIAFIAVGYVAQSWARSNTSPGMQYLGLGLYVVAEAVIFLPLLYFANTFFEGENVILTAGIMTLTVFVGLTLAVLLTGSDFSYLRTFLTVGSCLAIGLIIASMIFGFGLGVFFMFAMVALACGYIIYYTSNVLHYYRTDQHVAAALTLFAAVALLFWYILQIVMSSSRR